MVAVKPSWRTTRSNLKPGEFFALWRSKGLIFGFTAEAKREGHPPSCLVVHAAPFPELTGKYLDRIENQNGLLQLSNVEICFSQRDIQHGSPDYVPSGTLILNEAGPAFFVRTDDFNEFGIALDSGEIGAADLHRSFWTPRWKLAHDDSDDASEPIFEFGTTS